MSAEDHLSPSQFTGSTSLAEGHVARGATVPLYHRTYNAEGAESIKKFGFRGSSSGPDAGEVYLSSTRSNKAKSRGFGDHLITVDVPHNHPYLAHTDTFEHSRGAEEHWYALPADKIHPSWIRP